MSIFFGFIDISWLYVDTINILAQSKNHEKQPSLYLIPHHKIPSLTCPFSNCEKCENQLRGMAKYGIYWFLTKNAHY
jgi:hypothetical protein